MSLPSPHPQGLRGQFYDLGGGYESIQGMGEHALGEKVFPEIFLFHYGKTILKTWLYYSTESPALMVDLV